jgi:hypothetical protein
MEVHGGTWQYKNLLNRTYWYVLRLECTDSYGSIRVLLDSLLQCCQAESAVLKTSAYNHTYASSSRRQHVSINSCLPCRRFCYLHRPFFGGGRRLQLFFGGHRRGCGFRRRGRWRCRGGRGSIGKGVNVVGVGDVGRYWQRCSLGDELAGQGLGSRSSPRDGFPEDVLVDSSERVEELSPKSVRVYGIESLEIRCLKLLEEKWQILGRNIC